MCLRIHGCEIHVLCWEEDLLYEYVWLWDPFPMAAKKETKMTKNNLRTIKQKKTCKNCAPIALGDIDLPSLPSPPSLLIMSHLISAESHAKDLPLK